jgi:uncharacterized protein (TIGR03435 family)
MIFTNLTGLGNHVWQSTLCVGLAWLLTLAMRKNRAAVRYWIWLASSVKFLVPFSLFVSLGEQFVWRTGYMPPSFETPAPFVEAALPVASRVVDNAAPGLPLLPVILLALWLCGVGVGLLVWFRQWRDLRAVKRSAKRVEWSVGIPVMSSSARLEPGVFGILKPVLLLPAGITEHLTREQLETVLAHELCHVRRRDNLTAAIHMAVETVFWFHPLVWWIRARLIEERERACDEEVLRRANDPQTYAEGILCVCKLYLESPLTCAAGVTGADLKKRIAEILRNRMAYELDWSRRLLLIALGALVVTGPLAVGICAPASQTVAPSKQAFDVASIKPNKTGARNSGFRRFKGGQLDATNITLKMLISFAYDVPQNQIVGGPAWVDSERYDVLAKPEESASGNPAMALTRQRTQALLADRFQLTLRKDFKILPIFELVVAKGGPKNLQPPAKEGEPDLITNGHHVACRNASMEFFAKVFLTGQTGRPVVDKTGVDGSFDFAMDWTPDEAPPARAAADGNDERAAPTEFSGPTFFTALGQQLGLKLEAAKGPVQVFVVDHAEKASEN